MSRRDEVSDIRALYFALLDAWNRQDANGMAALYAEQGLQIGFDGSQVRGREAVRAHLDPIFRDHPTPCFVGKVRTCDMLGHDHALLSAVAGMVARGDDRINPQTLAVQSLVASRSDDGWRIELFQNTPASYHGRDEARASLIEELQALADRTDS